MVLTRITLWQGLTVIMLSLVLGSTTVLGQQLSYTNYDVKEGMPSSQVYRMTQDQQGFIWLGTGAGLTRFDGTKFLTFTTLDGLPDNDILIVHADAKNRIWIAPFRAEVCFYYKGKIHTQKNDSLLSKIRLESHVISISENEQGEILIQTKKSLYCVRQDNSIFRVESPSKMASVDFVNSGPKKNSGFWVQGGKNLYSLINDKLAIEKFIDTFSPHSAYSFYDSEIEIFRTGLQSFKINVLNGAINPITVSYPALMTRWDRVNDSLVAQGSTNGVYLFNLQLEGKYRYFLPDKTVNDMLIDREGNWWFATSGQGLYKLNSQEIKSYLLFESKNRPAIVTTITQWNEKLVAATDIQSIFQIDFRNSKADHPITLDSSYIEFHSASRIEPLSKELLFLGTLSHFKLLNRNLKVVRDVNIGVKDFSIQNSDIVAVATSSGVYRYRCKDLSLVDTIWPKRATSIFADGRNIYVGTLDGLICLKDGGMVEKLGEKLPVLSTRIASIRKQGQDTIWVATNGNGLVAIKDGILLTHLTEKNGLLSNLCKSMEIRGNTLWLSTDKGLNKVILNVPGFPTTKYTTADGLLSNSINALFVSDSLVYVASPAGLTYFDDKRISSSSTCDLVFTGLWINNEFRYPDSLQFELPHQSNNIRFDYVGISFKSQGDIQYKYRMIGVDTNWTFTRETSLSYPTLPSGVYELQIIATNKFGIASELKKISFEIRKTLTEKAWFRVLVILLTLVGAIFLIYYLINRARKREVEKASLNNRLMELEQLALKSQMNPHFIFNSLNSIQHFVMVNDIEGANRFISDFSKLIRQTLDYSSKSAIPLVDEINYLKTYMNLEKNRLEDKFSFEINVSDEILDGDFYVLPMILQPYIENSIRHGIRYRRDHLGTIKLSIGKIPGFIRLVLEDNGIGRKAAEQYKLSNPIEYQSKGMSLTADRIAIINRSMQAKVKVLIEDLVDQHLTALGTRVTVEFPDNLS